MGVSVDTASSRGSKKKPVDAELNLIPFIDLLLCCGHNLLDSRWVDAPIDDKSRERYPGHLTPHRIERRNHYHPRRIVDYHIHPGRFLGGPAPEEPQTGDEPENPGRCRCCLSGNNIRMPTTPSATAPAM